MGVVVGMSVDTVTTFLTLLPPPLSLNSEIYKLYELSKAQNIGAFTAALVAAEPSPDDEAEPVPATVDIIPVDIVTLRIRWL